MNLFVSRRYDSCFLKWYSESELLSFSFCFFSSFASSFLDISIRPQPLLLAILSLASLALWNISFCGIFRSVEFLTR